MHFVILDNISLIFCLLGFYWQLPATYYRGQPLARGICCFILTHRSARASYMSPARHLKLLFSDRLPIGMEARLPAFRVTAFWRCNVLQDFLCYCLNCNWNLDFVSLSPFCSFSLTYLLLQGIFKNHLRLNLSFRSASLEPHQPTVQS